MTKEFQKISENIKPHYHMGLTINSVKVDIDKDLGGDVSYALKVHNEMVERIEYLEYAISQFMSGVKADTSAKKVKYWSDAYCGNGFNVITGHGDAPKHFEAVSDSGVKIVARHGHAVAGGGHGEGRYVISRYDVNCVGADGEECYFFRHDEEIFTITKVIKP